MSSADASRKVQSRDTVNWVEAVNLATQWTLHIASYLQQQAASRRYEYEADLLALYIGRDAGTPVDATISGARLVFRMTSVNWLEILPWIEFLSTHPTHKSRLQALEAAAPKLLGEMGKAHANNIWMKKPGSRR